MHLPGRRISGPNSPQSGHILAQIAAYHLP